MMRHIDEMAAEWTHRAELRHVAGVDSTTCLRKPVDREKELKQLRGISIRLFSRFALQRENDLPLLVIRESLSYIRPTVDGAILGFDFVQIDVD
jgi:hypothetical protein